MLYSCLFVICGAALLAITYGLFASFADSPPKPGLGSGRHEPSPTSVKVAAAMSVQRSIGLHRLQLFSGIALAIMALASGVLGWLVAGRVLAPLRTITSTADQISDTNLHERIAMSGPRDELRQLADTIDRLLERLETAFEAQRRFVANASHELRTPLGMHAHHPRRRDRQARRRASADRELDAELRVDLDHADQLLESFLTLARAQDGQLGDKDHVALAPAHQRSALTARANEIAAKQLTVETRLSGVELAGSATLLGRMIENVIENAVRHNQPGGSIELTCGPVDAEHARVIIDSSGPILDQDDVAQLAQPFKRLSQDRTGSQDGHATGPASFRITISKWRFTTRRASTASPTRTSSTQSTMCSRSKTPEKTPTVGCSSARTPPATCLRWSC